MGPRPRGHGYPLARTHWRAGGGQGVATVFVVYREGFAETVGFQGNGHAAPDRGEARASSVHISQGAVGVA